MAEQVLEMRYHPAKKEVWFRRFQGEREIVIRPESRLQKYMQQEKGKFILQDHGTGFFDDIVRTFDGLSQVKMRVLATRPDFVDFQQMVEYYNENTAGKCRVSVTAGDALMPGEAYLADMSQIYNNVKDYGLKAVAVLDTMRHNFFNITTDKDVVREGINALAEEAQQEISSIKKKVDSLGDNNVNLCFAGVYSAGKSALINALLGYRILPENIKSKTARMFCIRSPRDSEPYSIAFAICNEIARLVWDKEKTAFEFDCGPSENDSTQAINVLLGEIKSKPVHEQICRILNQLNDNPDVCSDVEIKFPIPLDTEKVQFTIFDTPGTDSNYAAHQETLRKALSDQTNSILIFVVAPDRLEGTGNRNLLSLIKDTSGKKQNTTIDIGRSLLVINRSDTVEPEERIELQTGIITDTYDMEDDTEENSDTHRQTEIFTIKLSDKKLLFTSAKYAYAANAVKRGIATKQELSIFKRALAASDDEDTGRYYQQNKCAHSQYATEHMISQCNQALDAALDMGDQCEIVHICSGLYALENEIRLYGEKYAIAVRAYAMIDSVNQALADMYKSANSFDQQNEDEIRKISEDIEKKQDEIYRAITEAVGKYSIPDSKEIPTDARTRLGLDGQKYEEIKWRVNKRIKKRIKGTGLLWRNDPKSKGKAKQYLQSDIEAILGAWSGSFYKERDVLLKELRDNAIQAARDAIEQTGKLSPEAKKFILGISTPKIADVDARAIGRAYEDSTYQKDFLWMHTPYLDRKRFESSVNRELMNLWTRQSDNYLKEYCNILNNIMKRIQDEFIRNMNRYSLILKTLRADKESAERLRDEISQAAKRLEDFRKELDKRIWEVQQVGQ